MQNLIERAVGGDNKAFDQLVRLHYSAIYQLALHLTGNSADAQDITQQTFLSAYQKLHQLRDWNKFLAWLKSIAINEYRMWKRRAVPLISYDALPQETRQNLIVHQTTSPDVECERKELYRQLLDAINALSPKNRQAFTLHYIEEYSQKEVSEQLGISISAVENRIMRAKEQLRQRLRRTIIMVDEKLAKYGIEIAPLWQSHQFGLSFGYFCFEIRPKINALAIRIGKFLPKSGPRSVFYDVEKSLVELHLCYFKPMERAEEGNGKLFIEIRNIGVKSATTQHESYRPTKVGDSWREFVKVHLTEPVTANYGDEIDFFTVTNVEAEEDEIRWTLFFDSPAEFLRQSCIGCVQAAYRKGDTAKAIKILEDDIRKFHNLLKQAPDDGAIHYGLAVAYAMKLQSEDALNALKKALQLDKKYASKALDEEAFEFLRELEEFQRLL